MLPTTTDVVHAAEEVGAKSKERAIRRALSEAEHLVHDSLDVPAALHFTLTRHAGVFSHDGGKVLATLLETIANRLGLKILASRPELEARLGLPPNSVEDARDWFASRVVLFGG